MPRDLPPDIAYPTITPSLTHHSIPLKEWKAANPKYTALAIGAFIIRRAPPPPPSSSSSSSITTTGEPQLLLIKRAPTDSYPNIWEPPGGSVDLEDATLFHGLVREVWEETGLRVDRVERQVWDKDGSGKQEVSFTGKRGDKWCKLNFLVAVKTNEEGEALVRLDEEEHQDWGWFGREEMEGVPFVSEQGREIARNAFKAFAKGVNGGEGL